MTAEASSIAWRTAELASPATGLPLRPDGPDFLTDGRDRWPVVAGIPYLRTGREALRGEVNDRLQSGDATGALAELLRDRDDWAPGPPPTFETAWEVAGGRHSPRAAMELLGFGPVADYFTYRLSDPTYLAGLALLQGSLAGAGTVFELACGVGHYGRELARHGVSTIGGDVVFAKLWLARRHFAPQARLLCFDAAESFPLPDGCADLAFCHDALYFLPRKLHVAAELPRLSGGPVLVGHTHNAAAENLSAGSPLGVAEYADLFEDPLIYDDAELTRALLSGRPPTPRTAAELSTTPAIALADGGEHPGERQSEGDGGRGGLDLALPPPGTALSVNPLYEQTIGDDWRLRWPSPRYEAEYAPLSGYLPEEVELSPELLRRARQAGVGSDARIDRLARDRVLLDLPEGLS